LAGDEFYRCPNPPTALLVLLHQHASVPVRALHEPDPIKYDDVVFLPNRRFEFAGLVPEMKAGPALLILANDAFDERDDIVA
jgi:hypothetical protein